MQQHGRSRCTIPMLSLLIATGVATQAFADEPAEQESTVIEAQLVTEVEAPRSDERDWFGKHFRTAKGHGFEYRRSFTMGRDKRRFVFSVQGPLVKKKTPGIGFEIRF